MAYELAHRTGKTVTDGRYYPLGAALRDGGANFALYSQYAGEVFLLLFDAPDAEPTDVIRLDAKTRNIHHCFVGGVGAGQLYAYRVRGEHNPARGMRFNEHKTLIDPYAKALTGKVENKNNLLLSYDPGSGSKDLSLDTRDNTRIIPKCIVVDDAFDWQGDEPLCFGLEQLLIYEAHVKGLTAHPSSGVKHPGTYLGVVEKIPYLKHIGINAVEFLPLHEFYVDDFLGERGLTNYWGYNTIGFFAPESSYCTGSAPGCQVAEFKTMVRELHKAGIEVIMDVVYNHSGEGSEMGPTFSFRGIDNPTYYRLTGTANEPYRYYMNYTGCGNTLNLDNPHVIRFVMDSLRYWVEVMHVDGFRFDLASVLGREEATFKKSASFFDAISQDPVLSRAKLIAEPWDLGTYQVGEFPIDWSEWNGKFRDTMRRFGKGEPGVVPDVGRRITGSSDLYGEDGRSAYNSVNFITCHDGFTMYDLVSYNTKHNEQNGEGGRDGTDDNNSWNCGAEGDTSDPAVMDTRRRQVKNFFCHLLFSSGTPMVLGGDEFMRTQKGNNNAYCQDNETSWFDWGLVEKNAGMVEFFRKAAALPCRYTILQRRKFFIGADLDRDCVPDITWFGTNLDRPAWDDPECRTLCCRLDGGEDSSDMGDYQIFMIMNSDWREKKVMLPAPPDGKRWRRVVDTALPEGQEVMEPEAEVALDPAEYYIASPRSTVLLVWR